jgi:hypothetical protein
MENESETQQASPRGTFLEIAAAVKAQIKTDQESLSLNRSQGLL